MSTESSKKIDIANFDMRDVVNKCFTPDVSAYEGHINVLIILLNT